MRSSGKSSANWRRGGKPSEKTSGLVPVHFFMRSVALFYRPMRIAVVWGGLVLWVAQVQAQIQVELKLPRLQFIAYEPVIASVGITNLAGRHVDLPDAEGHAWFGF